ncbi:histidine phosphatase family protein [bacterium]|jgi:broad specificity phosphatase PhoE|nr:histidine phosphatase family protein [Mariniblastus sp.]MDB4386356.1 histidine phosphatase family protein [bacterium]MDA7924660.1 histidine phosphatase family protein [Mariniblastus sp.]MDB4372258.1 histidine phosphatase family protein [Mariniblastus sp.]MDB4468409.1 histidine phosphatase family protein [bacterium]
MSEIEFNEKPRILLVRAGSTDLDDQDRIVGSLDMPLSPEGEREARAIAQDLGEAGIVAIFSAAGLASQQTARQLSRSGEIRVRVEESFVNLNYGLWHGKSRSELKENQPKLYRQWQDNPDSICPPDGEPVEAVRDRVKTVLKKIRRKHKTGTIAIVAPDPLLSILRSELEGTEVRDLLDLRSQENAWCDVDWVSGSVS